MFGLDNQPSGIEIHENSGDVANKEDIKKFYRPHLVKQVLSPDGTVVKDIQPEIMAKLDLKPATIDAIKAGMDVARLFTRSILA